MIAHRSLRYWHDALLLVLGVVCATYWFGNSGAGLVILWWESRRPSRTVSAPDTGWIETLDEDRLTFAYVGTWRMVVIGQRCGRRDVFRDELSAVAWTRLRRRCLTGQPATGRSTSI